ncbi:MAG: cellulase family glycosylhydrolase [Oscillospiraceae bacterium]
MDENKTENNDVNETQSDKKTGGLSKKIIAVIAAMGVVIVALIIAVCVLASGGEKKSDSSSAAANSKAASESADDTETDAESESDEPADEETEEDESSEEEEEETDDSEEDKNEEKSETDENETGFVFYYSGNNTWENGGVTMTGMEMSVKNVDGDPVSDWKLVLEIEGLESCDGWNGTYKCDGNKLTITPADYNKELPTGGMIEGLGCNIGTKGTLNVKSAKLSGKECTIKKGSVPKNNNNNNNNNSNNNGGDVDVEKLLERTSKAKQGDDWLHTDGSKIYDKDGKEVWLTGVNWFGYNTGTNTFDGLWNSVLTESVVAIADHGFNLIRVPFSAELINQWADGEYPQANYNNAYNTELNSMNSLEIFDYFLKLAEENGIKVIVDIHCAETNASGHTVNLWFTEKVSTNEYYAALEWMADRYKDNDTIIGFDLKNEPHGKPNEGSAAAKWDNSKDKNNWKYVAETAAKKVLAKNPNVLILVEGTETYPKKKGNYSSQNNDDYYFNWWGGNLRAVKDYPIDLGEYQDKLVYSPHDYGPTVYQQPWFEGDYDYNSLMKDCWKDNWFYIYEDDIAPLLIGEWGGFMTEPNLTWMTHMRTLISKYHLHHTFWCFNANSGDTGGLVLDDFKTWDDEKYNFVKKVLWQEDGKFVGLDHEIPLGKNGITLKKAKGL